MLQHFERTAEGPLLCRSENFVPLHADLRRLLRAGAMLEVASALLGEPAVLYKEKINDKLPGGAGYSAHQDAPAYPMIDAHVSAMVAVDGADEGNGNLEVVSGCFDEILPTDERGCIDPAIAAGLEWREPFGSAAPGVVPDVQRGTGGRSARRVLRGEARRVRRDTHR